MPKQRLPAYAIVELLIRLAHLNPNIGDYKGHAVHSGYTLVKTTGGVVRILIPLVTKQFEAPETITYDDLALTADSFRPLRPRGKPF
ncbi:hypothetical protein GCM10023149_42610 [Mucilaginibacter gynuensis]|uniref:Uncharacterized protein n=1 Tax=Mucilaginibacter gynuensis TaxID=1302236 RepID=A0ABP8H6A4_9SPHI